MKNSNMEILAFRMYAGVKFNREIDVEKDYISPGGYEFVMNGKTVRMDFEDYSGKVNKDDKCLLEFEVRNPMYDEFAELKDLTKEMLRSVTEIKEFFVFTGEPGESDLKPIELNYVTFVLPYDDWKNINVAEEVVKTATVASN